MPVYPRLLHGRLSHLYEEPSEGTTWLLDSISMPSEQDRYAHLLRLTDDVGVIQHATHAVANRTHGYCTDDVGRALVAICPACTDHQELVNVVDTCLAYLLHAASEPGRRFKNFMAFDRTWLDPEGSEDAHGRALWGLGVVVRYGPTASHRELAGCLLRQGAGALRLSPHIRSWGYALLGFDNAIRGMSGNEQGEIHRERDILLDQLVAKFSNVRGESQWPWPEQSLTYDNALLPWALIEAGDGAGNALSVELGLDVLEWLMRVQIAQQGHLSLVGNSGWMSLSAERTMFDQQPIDAASVVGACAAAYRVSGADVWREYADLGMRWFVGGNDVGAPLYDPETQGCCDGLGEYGANANQGAESTIAWLMALRMYESMR